MKISYKAVLLTALGITAVTAAHAQTSAGSDFVLGFNDLAGPSAAQNDYVIDLGPQQNINAGVTWTWSIDPSAFSTAFGADSRALNNVAVGVVEGSTSTFFQTIVGAIGQQPSVLELVSAANYAQGIYTSPTYGASGTTVTSNPNWSYMVSAGPSDLTGQIANHTDLQPMANLAGGEVVETLYESAFTGSGRSETASSLTPVGTFDVNANADTITFTGADVPEPNSLGLLGGAGLLILAFRNKLSRKQA